MPPLPTLSLPWSGARPLPDAFFDRDAQQVARTLLGKVLRHRVDDLWLSARIIETEAYYLNEKGSHSSLGATPSRRAMFMPPGHLYLYYARGGDSLNISVQGAGNAVLIKAGRLWQDSISGPDSVQRMQRNNPDARGQPRPPERLCSGQTLLCKALGLKVAQWNARRFDPLRFFIDDLDEAPGPVLQTRRLGIPSGRDEHLAYRFVEAAHADQCTRSPLRRGQLPGRNFFLLTPQDPTP
ncbi:MAG: DNA-3-methyladenine glycosylase [Pseudomonas sp.]|uniref:DNA-3-methyladenine glycosylase n=1 Tax=Pseudomonas sp. TaxID=306 RepID=UPI003398181B